MSNDRVVRRLTVLKEDAGAEPAPQRKFFHIGQPEVLDDLGECIPMISWVDENLSRFVVSDAPSATWGKTSPLPKVLALPNRQVHVEDGIFLITGPGNDYSAKNPSGKGHIHFVHLGITGKLWDRGLVKIYLYRLDGVQMKSLLEKKK
ncbi:MAG: hypothetical protein IPK82_36885 [Polyangiaceae bacterium]|nr:hypothetical protein [Polyangiaceae bacterium]